MFHPEHLVLPSSDGDTDYMYLPFALPIPFRVLRRRVPTPHPLPRIRVGLGKAAGTEANPVKLPVYPSWLQVFSIARDRIGLQLMALTCDVFFCVHACLSEEAGVTSFVTAEHWMKKRLKAVCRERSPVTEIREVRCFSRAEFM